MNRDLILVAFALITWGFGEGLFILFQPLYLEELGASPIAIGVILGGIGIAMTIAHLPAGYLSDRIGRRPLLFAAWILGVSAIWVMALANTLQVFVLGAVIYAVTAFVISPLNSYITAARGKLAVGRVLTLTSAAFNVGAIGGPLLGGWIAENFGLRYNFILAGCVFVISTFIIINIRSQPVVDIDLREKRSITREIFTSRYIRYLTIVFFVMFALYLPQPLSQNFLQNERGVDLSQIGALISARSAGGVLLNLTIGRLSAGLGFVLAQAAMGLFTLIIWHGTGMPWYFLGYLLMGGYQTARAMVSAQARSLVDAANMGLAYGTVETVNSTAIILAPPLAGYLYSQNPEYIYSFSFVLICAGILITILFSPIGMKKIKD